MNQPIQDPYGDIQTNRKSPATRPAGAGNAAVEGKAGGGGMSRWQFVPTGDLLTQVDRFEPVGGENEYRLLGVRLEGAGPFLRETVSITETSANRLNQVKAGDFIYSRLFAWRGAFGVIPAELDGCFVSNEFPIFQADKSRIDTGFLNYWFRLPAVWRQVEDGCTGSTPLTRNRFKEQLFLNLKIPFPSLEEQRAIVARLDAVAEKARQVEARLDGIEADAKRLLAIRFRAAIEGAQWRPIAEVAPVVRRNVEIDLERRYSEIGARSFGKGLFFKPHFDGAEATWQKPVWISKNDLVLSNIKAWEGAIAVADEIHNGCIASHRYITCAPLPEKITPNFICYHLLTEEGLEQIGKASPGTADRNRTLSLMALRSIKIPVPKLAKQQAFDKLQAKVAEMKAKHAETRQSLKALLPSMLEQLFGPG